MGVAEHGLTPLAWDQVFISSNLVTHTKIYMFSKRSETVDPNFYMEWIEVPVEIYIRSDLQDNPVLTKFKHAKIHVKQENGKWVFFFTEMECYYVDNICIGCGAKR